MLPLLTFNSVKERGSNGALRSHLFAEGRTRRGGSRRSFNEGTYSFSMDTSVALIIAKTLSPSLRFIRSTEPVVMIDVTFPAAVRITSSDTTLSETIFSIVPGSRFRMLVLTVGLFPQFAQ